jgi:hypothetical protein
MSYKRRKKSKSKSRIKTEVSKKWMTKARRYKKRKRRK